MDQELPALNHVSEDPTPGPEGSVNRFDPKWKAPVSKQPTPGTGQMVVSEKQWDDLQEAYKKRLENQRNVIENLDAARIHERDQRVALVEKLETIRDDLSQLSVHTKDNRERVNYEVLRDTVADLIRVYR